MAAPVSVRTPPRTNPGTNSSRLAIHRQLDDFLKNLDNRPDMMDQISKYLQHRPQWEEPRDLIPVDEVEQRLDLVEKYQTWKRAELAEEAEEVDPDDDEAQKQAAEWKLTRLAYAACMTMPLSLLVEYTKFDLYFLFASEEQSSKMNNPKKRSGIQQPAMKRAAKRRKGSHERTDVNSGADSATEESAQSSRDRRIQLSEKIKSDKERKKALDYDEGRCRISGSTRPGVAHIIPFSFSNSTINMERTQMFRESFNLFNASTTAASYIAGGQLGLTDKLFNLVCLDRNLQSNWDKGYLGIKYLAMAVIPGQGNTEITLQAVWMPMVKAAGFSYNDLIDLDDERDKYSGFAYTIQSQAGTAPGHKVFRDSGWPIVSGDKFTIRRPTDYAEGSVEMIKLRWHLGQLAAISGAVGDSDFIFGQDEVFERRVRDYGRHSRQIDREREERELEAQERRAAQSQ
ncbi:unnamed protein product [Clonostachys byssicola]|uniref:HNH nuclease domain-containing protein n=1 Tax=Clonostachys byssicola TaxID=160290 RepID=A0A9N9UJD2_9HYPO|nr:unnamed protein product [Clonostachys byssicola]